MKTMAVNEANKQLASYQDAVDWIAGEDEPLERDPVIIAKQVTACLVADLFNRSPGEVAADVLRSRGVI